MSRPVAFAVIAGLLILAVGAYLLLSPGQAEVVASTSRTYYYDLETGQVRALERAEAPAPGEAVQAHLFSCGDCGESHFVGYISRVRPEVSQAVGAEESPDPRALRDMGMDPGNIYEYAVPADGDGDGDGDLTWYAQATPQGRAVTGRASEQCPDGGTAQICRSGSVTLTP